jgi:hypothetical protein
VCKRKNCAAGAGHQSQQRNTGQHGPEKEEGASEQDSGKEYSEHRIGEAPGFAAAHKARDEWTRHRQPEQQNAEDEHPYDGARDTSLAVWHASSFS